MLAEAEHIEPRLIGEFDLLDQVFQPLLGIDLFAADRVGSDIAECVESELHGRTFLP